MILILGQEFELNINRVCEILDFRKIPWIRFNGEDFPMQSEIAVSLGDRGSVARLTTRDGKVANTDQIRAVWARRNGQFVVDPALSPGRSEFVAKECVATVLGMFSMLSHAQWMNDYFAEKKALNKPYQLYLAKEVGLAIPDTLITQSPDEARAFYRRHDGAVLCKAIGQSGYVPGSNGNGSAQIYANRLSADDYARLDRVRHAPTLLQSYTEKLLELRVTVVGHTVYATAIESQNSERTKVDWRRYDTPNTPYYRYRLPENVSGSLIRLMRRLGLEYGAADLILTPKGEYVFLEVNPGGQWGWVEDMTGHPIDAAIADWLTNRSGMENRHAVRK